MSSPRITAISGAFTVSKELFLGALCDLEGGYRRLEAVNHNFRQVL